MSECHWCGREYDYGYIGGYCSKKCYNEYMASLNASSQSSQNEKLSREQTEASRAAEAAADRAAAASNRAAAAAERQAEAYEAMQEEIKKQRLDAKAQSQGFADYPDMLRKNFDAAYEKQVEEFRAKYQSEIDSTSQDKLDLRLAKYIELAIDSSGRKTEIITAIVKKKIANLDIFLLAVDGKNILQPSSKFEYSLDFIDEDFLDDSPKKIINASSEKAEAEFLFTCFSEYAQFFTNDEYNSSNWLYSISLQTAYEYLYDKYCKASSSNEVKRIFDGIVERYNQKTKKIIKYSISIGAGVGLLLGIVFANLDAENLGMVLVGGLGLIGLIVGGLVGAAEDITVVGAIAGLIVAGLIGMGIQAAFSIPILGILLMIVAFGAIGFGVAKYLISENKFV